MKLIYDYQIFSQQRYGGISRYFCELAKEISLDPAFDAEIFAPLYVNEYLRRAAKGFYLPRSPAFLRGTIEKLNTRLSRHHFQRSKPFIVHETYYSRTRLAPPGARTVLSVYDMIHEIFPRLFPNDPTSGLKAVAVQNADHIICISEQTKKDLVAFLKVDPVKISVTHLGSDFWARKAEISDRPFPFPYVLYVGPRGAYKNFSQLLRAFSESTALQKNFRIVSFGSSAFSPDEIEAIRKLGLNPEQVVHVEGDDRRLPNLYAHAEVFVYPSLYEGFGIPLVEAMAMDCPIVCSAAGSIPEIAGAAAMYFDPNNATDLKDALEKVLYSREKRASLVEAGRERGQAFTWKNCAENTKKIYLDLI